MPAAKLIVLMRNPVDRAFSQYHMQARDFDGVSFEEAIDLDHPAGLEPIHHFLERGHYARYAARWLEHFTREQMLFLQCERFFADPLTGLKKVYDSLGLDELSPTDLSPRVVGTYSDMRPENRTGLTEYFRDSDAELVKLLGPGFACDEAQPALSVTSESRK